MTMRSATRGRRLGPSLHELPGTTLLSIGLGVLGILLALWAPPVSLPCSVIAAVLGGGALIDAHRGTGATGPAVAGFILGLAGVLLMLLTVVGTTSVTSVSSP